MTDNSQELTDTAQELMDIRQVLTDIGQALTDRVATTGVLRSFRAMVPGSRKNA